jgi:hypothetical protein
MRISVDDQLTAARGKKHCDGRLRKCQRRACQMASGARRSAAASESIGRVVDETEEAMRSLRLQIGLLTLFLGFLLAGCSGKSAPAGVNGIPAAKPFHDLRDLPGTIADVTLTSNTVRIDEATTHHILKSIGSDGDVFVFDNSDKRIQDLHEGQIFLLDNVAVRKVVAVAKKDNLVIVGTDYASLTDFIQQGHLKWNAPIHFGSLYAQAKDSRDFPSPTWGMWLMPGGTVYASSQALSYSGKVDGWDTSMSVTPGSNRLDMTFKVSRNYQGMGVMLSTKGYLKDFLSSADIEVAQNDLSNFSYSASDVNGEIDVDYAATRDGDAAGIDKPNIKLPPLAKIPMPLDGIPFMLTINANLILKPGFGAKKEAASGTFKITYDGAEGFSVKGGTSQPSGTMDGNGSIENITTASLAPHAILIGIAAPKITLSLGFQSAMDTLQEAFPPGLADTLSNFLANSSAGKWVKKKMNTTFKTEAAAFVQTVAVGTMASAGSLAMIPCKLTRLLLEFQGGADVYLLGKKGLDKDLTLAKKEFVVREPDINACGEK